MISALFFLQVNSLRNRLFARFARLRQLKYLITAVIGTLFFGLYLCLIIGRVFFRAGTGSGILNPDDSNLIGSGLLLFFMVMTVVSSWILQNQPSGLLFTEAEIAFLFTAPITRRQLITYKLASSQIPVLISTLFITLLTGRWHYGLSHAVFALVGWWIIITTLNFHSTAAALARNYLRERGIKNRGWLIALFALVCAVGLFFFIHSVTRLPVKPEYMGDDSASFFAWVKGVLTTDWMPYLLYPFRLIVMPYNAPDFPSFLFDLLPAFGILALYYVAVIHMDVSFEEASIAVSQKRATRIAAVRTRQATGSATPKKAKPAPFPLKPIGPAYLAIVWKNLIHAGHFFNPRMFFRIVIFVVIFSSFDGNGHGQSSTPKLAYIGLILLFFSFFYGPNLFRIDFRADLSVIDQLMLYPVPSWQIVLGEILSPVVVLAAFQWLLILLVALTYDSPDDPMPQALRISAALGAALLAPMIDLIMLLTPNAVALIMPSWVRFDVNAPRGFENIGQNIILSIGRLVVVFIALIPAGLAGGLVYAGVHLVTGQPPALLAGALMTAVVLGAEGAFAIYLLGGVFNRFDVSGELTN